MYAVALHRPLQSVEQSGEDMSEKVKAVIGYPEYSTPRIAKLSSLEDFQQGSLDMNHIVKLLSTVMDVKAQGGLLCSAPQSKMR